MDEAAQVRTAGRPLLPRRVHIARADRDHRLPQQGRRLRSLVQGFLADNAHDSGRSQAPGRQDLLHLGTPNLGLRDEPSSTRPHDLAARCDIARRHALYRLPFKLTLAGTSEVVTVPSPTLPES